MGLPRACPWSSRSRRSSGSPARPTSRPSGSRSSTRAAASRCSAYVDLWEQMTDRMGCWIDMRDPYRSMDPRVHRVGWWALKQNPRQGPAGRGLPGGAILPRCGTGLSDHELAQGYETVTDPSVYVRFPSRRARTPGSAESPGASLIVWTTTPWTLVSNALVATHPEMTYVTATNGEETLWSPSHWSRRLSARGDRRPQVCGHRHGRLDLPGGRSIWSEWPARTDGADLPDAHFVVHRGLRHRRGRHGARAPVPRLR
jgi:isoleucyl-tRNA synthetase